LKFPFGKEGAEEKRDLERGNRRGQRVWGTRLAGAHRKSWLLNLEEPGETKKKGPGGKIAGLQRFRIKKKKEKE